MKAAIFIYSFFLLTSFALNFYRIYQWWHGVTLEYQDANDMWNASLMTVAALPFIAFFIQDICKIHFGFWDRGILFICFVFTVLDGMDWYWNFNMREDLVDWRIFIIFNLALIALMYFTKYRNLKNGK